MQQFFSIVGLCTAALIAIALAMAAFGFMVECLTNFQERRDEIVQREERKEFGNRLVNASWWFSEDNSAFHAIKIIGQSVTKHGGFDVSDCRDQWRQAIKNERKETVDA